MAKIPEASSCGGGDDGMPEGVITTILSRVPVESLLRFNSVSKSWYSIISKNPNFVQLHLNCARINPKNHGSFVTHNHNDKSTDDYHDKFTHLQFNNNNGDVNNNNYENAIDLGLPFRRGDYPPLPLHPKMTLSGSCNGILCVWVDGFNDEEFTFLWNPATKYSMLLPKSGIGYYYQNKEADNVSLGFGFEPVAGDYKVVRLLDFEIKGVRAEVYSTKECVWREVKAVKDFPVYGRSGVCAKGVLYWLLKNGALLTFDLRNEVFGVHRWPESVSKSIGDDLYGAQLVELGSFVALAFCPCRDGFSCVIKFWIFPDMGMDGHGNVVLGSWIRGFRFEVDRAVRFVYGFLRTGYFLMKDDSGACFLYNPSKKKTHNLSHLRDTHHIVKYTASLVSFVGSGKFQWKPTYSKKDENSMFVFF